MENNNNNNNTSYWAQYQQIMRAGIPAGVASVTAFSGAFRDGIAPGVHLQPSRLACVGFGSMFALGSWMMYDGDYKNGAGFISAWSLLYTMMNGKAALKSRGIYGKGLALLVLTNFAGYAREFVRAPPTRPPGVRPSSDSVLSPE